MAELVRVCTPRFYYSTFRRKTTIKMWLTILLLSPIFYFLKPGISIAETKGHIAILPFSIYTKKPIAQLKKSLQEMLILQIREKGYETISPERINSHPSALLPALKENDLIRIGREVGADWIVSGSLTQIGEKLSVDFKVIDVLNKKPPFYLFMVADSIDSIPEMSRRIATSIDHEISGVVQVDSVLVEGNKRIETEAILSVMNTRKGDSFDYDQLDKDLRGIFKMGFFEDVQINTENGPKGKVVILKVVEKPSIGKIIFHNNKKIKDKDLKDQVGIKLYTILDRNEIKQSVNRLKDYYRKKGYYNIEIKEEIGPLPNNEVLLTYEISEHEKVFISQIVFKGNNQFDDDELKDKMETSEKGFFSWLSNSGYLDETKLEFDTHKIESFYHNQGYIKAKVGDPVINYENEKGLTITIEVNEGPQYGVSNVNVEGDLIKPVDELLDNIRILKEKTYNRETIRTDVMTLREIYADEGYAFAEVMPITKEDNDKFVVDIVYRISKQQKVKFERINISGNSMTRDKVIRRELKVIEGEYFSGRGLKRSSQNLFRLGFFEDVKIKPKKGSRDDLMILDVGVKERSTGSFSMGAGYSSLDKAFTMFEVAENNLFGRGQKLSASGKLGGTTTEFDIRFTEPWLFNRPISAGVDLFKLKREYTEYIKDSVGGAVGFGFPLGLDYTRGSVRYAYDDADITGVADDASESLKAIEGRTVTSGMTWGIRRNSKDRPWNTRKGSLNSLTFEYAGRILGGDSSFNKYELKSAWFFPFIKETVFMLQGRLGYVQEKSDGFLPAYQKFRIGGINTVRGFDFGDISPRDPLTGDRIGGEKMMVYNFEYRFPLVKDKGVIGLVFFDAGNVFTKDESWNFRGIRKSVGAGIRWYSPLGPLRLEYGKNLDPRDDEKSGNFEFSIGGTF